MAVVAVGLVGAGYLAGSQAAKPQITATVELMNPGVKFGEYAKFSTTISKNANNPRLVVKCYQNTALVYAENEDPTSAASIGTKLGGDSSPWVSNGGGAADCSAFVATYVLKSQKWTVTPISPTISFSVAP